MNNIKSIFSIKDLENLSGIKAHTIRIWEKRYNVLSPMRTGTNIRYYDLANLRKLLNITLLHNHGYKISKIGALSDDELLQLVRDIVSEKSAGKLAINAFKIAMMTFDQKQFFDNFNFLLSGKSFQQTFYEVIIPLLDDIGMLWQTGTITPAHEHFISYLIRQKLLTNTEAIQSLAPTKTHRNFILFLPEGELHELGLLFINYEVLLHGFRAIYLGEHVPVSSMTDIRNHFENNIFICYLTVSPHADDFEGFVNSMMSEILQPNDELWIIGKNAAPAFSKNIPPQVKAFRSIPELVSKLENV